MNSSSCMAIKPAGPVLVLFGFVLLYFIAFLILPRLVPVYHSTQCLPISLEPLSKNGFDNLN